MANITHEIFDIVDQELAYQKKANGEGLQINIYSNEGRQALQIIQKYKLLYFRSSNINSSIVDITNEGRKVLENGGIKNYLDSIEQKVLKKENKEALETKKLEEELLLIQNQLRDYKLNKRIARAAFIFSLIALLAQMYQLFIKK